jgi:hypothetical protein
MKGRIRIATLGALAVGAITLVGASVGSSVGAATSTGYSASVSSSGLNLVLFGQKLLGGNSTACVNQGTETANKDANGATPCDTKATPYSYASGGGTVLTSSGLSAVATALAAGNSQSDPVGTPTVQKCSPVTTGGPVGGGGVTINLGVGCGYANASNDASGNPSAYSGGEVALAGVNLAGVLSPIVSASSSTSKCTTSSNQLIGALLNTVCQVLGAVQGGASAAPAPVGTLIPGVEQALQNIYDTATNAVAGLDTVHVTVGGTTAAVCSGTYISASHKCANDSSGNVTAESSGSTLDVSLLQGVGCTPGTSLLTCAANEVTHLTDETANPTAAPLVEVTVGPASCTATRDPSTGLWTSSAAGNLVGLDVNLPGDPIVVNIPGSGGTSQTILSGTPLQSTISVASTAAAPIGDTASCTGNALTLNLLQSSTFPGGSSTTGAVYATLGSTTLSATNNNVPAVVTSPSATPPVVASPAAPQAAPAAAVPNVTTVHTGEFWSGWAGPTLLAAMGLGGLALITRRRILRVARALMAQRGSKFRP